MRNSFDASFGKDSRVDFMIHIDKLNLQYEETSVVKDFSLSINDGEIVLLVGPTGSGKSSILHCIAGLVPMFTGGATSGDIAIDGNHQVDTDSIEWAKLVGHVAQSPRNTFVAEVVEDEIVFGMENFGLSQHEMAHRLEELLAQLDLADLRHRRLASLSAGQQQRVAIAAALATKPRVLLLDEPTSALDETTTTAVLTAIQRLVEQEQVSVILTEHHIDRVAQIASKVITLPTSEERLGAEEMCSPDFESKHLPHSPADVAVSLEAVNIVRDSHKVISEFSLELNAGTCCVIRGANGSGKTTLLHAVAGLMTPISGAIHVNGANPLSLRGAKLAESVALVPQQPSDLFIRDSVIRECEMTDATHRLSPGSTLKLLRMLAPHIDTSKHPHDLSEGQQLLLAFAIAVAGRPRVILLDEPTRGLDSNVKNRVAELVRLLKIAGHCVIVATHDDEFADVIADVTIELSQDPVNS
jgi:energy-coupling factor transporter ATP-binding protein EcfA2